MESGLLIFLEIVRHKFSFISLLSLTDEGFVKHTGSTDSEMYQLRDFVLETVH